MEGFEIRGLAGLLSRDDGETKEGRRGRGQNNIPHSPAAGRYPYYGSHAALVALTLLFDHALLKMYRQRVTEVVMTTAKACLQC